MNIVSDYPDKSWVYVRSQDNTYRFVLGRIKNPNGKTLAVVGINPSIAAPDKSDRTIESISSIAKNNNYDNWIMLNIYPFRTTDPEGIPLECDDYISKINFEEISKVIIKYHPSILFGYGNLITSRKWLQGSLNDIFKLIYDEKCECFIIKMTKLNNPIHPSRQRRKSILRSVVLNNIFGIVEE